MDINRVTLFGRLGRDPEVRFTAAGRAVCTFSMATSETWQQDGQEKKDTQWHHVVAWGKLAERLGEVLAKGTLCFVEGKLVTETYEKAGEKRYATKVVARVCFPLATPTTAKPAGTAASPPPADGQEDSAF